MPAYGLCKHWHTQTHLLLDVATQPLIPALGKQRQVDFCELEASLGYRESFRTGLYSKIT